MSQLFSRLDFLGEVSRSWRTLGWRRIRDLLPISWRGPWPHLRAHVLECAREFADNPAAALAQLDQMQASAPTALSQLGQTLESFASMHADPRPAHQLTSLMADFVPTVNPTDYPYARPALFEFCLREFIHPDAVAAVIEAQAGQPTDVSAALREDWPLCYVFLAYCLIWA